MAVYLCGGCPTEACNTPTAPCQTQTVTYSGAVLGRYERNGAHDSDFHATVWDADSGTVRDVWYAATSSWTYHNSAAVDATPEVIEQAMAWYRPRWIETTAARHRAEAAIPKEGRVVRSTTTRGRNVGVTGEVMWIGDNRYRRDVKRLRLKAEGQAGAVYLDADRVEVVNPSEPDMRELRAHAPHLKVPHWGGLLRSLAAAAPHSSATV